MHLHAVVPVQQEPLGLKVILVVLVIILGLEQKNEDLNRRRGQCRASDLALPLRDVFLSV